MDVNTMTMTAYYNGEFMPRDQIRLSPDDRGFLFADGIYEVVRCYNGDFFRMRQHLERLARGLRELRISGVDAAVVGDVCVELVNRNKPTPPDLLVYVQVTRGVAPRAHPFPKGDVTPTVYATLMPYTAKGNAAEGVSVITTPDIRWARCDVKSIALLPNCLANQTARDAGATEAIFVRDGVALEGTATSFFGVFDGVVRTAPTSNYILPGITRAAVLETCETERVPVEVGPMFAHELPAADELFLVGTTVEVMPIVRLDGCPVASGQPGPVTQHLGEVFGRLTRRQ